MVREEHVFAPAGRFEVRGRLVSQQARDRLSRGRRVKNRQAPDTGRYVRARLPRGRIRAVAVDATLRAAAPHQLDRGGGPGRAVRVLPEDLR